MIYARPQCEDCKHINRDKGQPKCTAFPDGIPKDILMGDFDHKKSYPGDNGIKFEAEES